MTQAIAPAPRARRRAGRLRLYSRAALFALVVAFAISVVSASGASSGSGRLGGDFPAFYAAGSIVADGDWDELYDADRQAEAQAELLPDAGDGAYLYFAYPPHAAALYRPLAALDYQVAYTLHTLAMTAALIGGLALLRPMVDVVHRHFELAVTASLLFYPMLRAVTGGQNTALAFLGFAATWRLLHDDRDVGAGLVVALLLFKPQLALPLVGLLLVSRRWRAVAAAGAGAGILWLVGAGVMGAGWLTAWLGEVSDFAALDADVNGHNAVSFLGVADHLFGAGSTTALLVAAPFVCVTAAAAIRVWTSPTSDLASRMAVATVAVILASPHAMFYDAGLLVLVAVVALDRAGARLRPWVGACWALAWLHLWAGAIGLAPLFAVVIAAAAGTAIATRGPHLADEAPPALA